MDINIPSQIKTFANVAAFPSTGSAKTIYIAEDTDIAYYWTGSAYQAISIQDLSGLVPYTGATQDTDLGNNGLDAKFLKIKGTGGTGHLNMKHQSSNPTAGGSETVIFAGSDGEPRFKNDGNAIEQFASRQWVNLQGFITNVITALGFTPVPNTRTVNGKALSSNITLTPSDIGSPSGSGTSTGTNTGDETQASILSKLGWWKVLDATDSPTLTGIASETIVKAVELPTLTSKFKVSELRVTKAGVSACTIRAYINNVSNNLAGSVPILTTGGAFPVAGLIATVERTFEIQGGNIEGFNAATGVFTDKGQSTATPLNATLPTGTLYLIVTLTQAIGESSQVKLIDVSNF